MVLSCLFATLAAAGQPPLPSPTSGRGVGGEGGRTLTPAQRKAALEAARAEAQPRWLALIEEFPQSRHLPEALYHAGVLFSESSPNRDADKSATHFERLVKEFPTSPWTGDAHARLIDVCLDQRFDLTAAERHAQAAVKWLAESGGEKAEGGGHNAEGADLPSPAGRGAGGEGSPISYFPLPTAQPPVASPYAIFLRAGLIEYLSERCPKAVEWFEKARRFAPPQDFIVVQGHIPTGIEQLIELARAGKYLTPDEARQGDPTARLILMLADVYHEGEEWQKSLDLCTRVIDAKGFKPTSQQKSWAHFKRGRNYYCLEDPGFNSDAALADYLACVRASRRSGWADKAMFLGGNILWNHAQDPDGAISVWWRLIREYPNSSEVPRAAYFIGVAYYLTDRMAEAETAFGEFVSKHPHSRFVTSAREHLDEIAATGHKASRGRKGKQ